MLQISFFGKDIPVIMTKKKDKFYISILWITNRFNTLFSKSLRSNENNLIYSR